MASSISGVMTTRFMHSMQLTGAQIWALPSGVTYSSPAVANGVVYIGGWDQKVHAIGNHVLDAFDQAVVTEENQSVGITLYSTDPKGKSLIYSVVTNPTHGTLTGTAPSLTYTPNLNYHGVDTFTFKANNGSLDSNIATVTITMKQGVPGLRATDDYLVYNYGGCCNMMDNDNNPPYFILSNDEYSYQEIPDSISVEITQNPQHLGVHLYGDQGQLYVFLNGCVNGIDSDIFRYRIKDGDSYSNEATAFIQINRPNLPGYCKVDLITYNIPKDTTIDQVTPTVEPESHFDVTLDPKNGTLLKIIQDYEFLRYIPNTGFTGHDQLKYIMYVDIRDSVTCGCGESTVNIDVGGTTPPIAAFTNATPRSGTVPLTVSFTDQSTGSITSYAWNFGDGGTSTDQSPAHQYTVAGSYPVNLTVTGPGGSDFEYKTNYITANPAPIAPVAAFSGTPRTGIAPFVVHFTDNSKGSPIGWAWYFGDETYTGPWTQMSENAWFQRTDHASVVMPEGSIVMMGGMGWTESDTDRVNDVWRSTDNGATWKLMNLKAEWIVRAGHSSVAMPDGSIVMMGGSCGINCNSDYGDDSGVLNDVWRSMDNGATWKLMNASAAWTPRFGHSSVVMPDGSIVLMGGSWNNNDVWRSTDNGATWKLMNASPGWTARYEHTSVVMPDSSIVLMGGWDGPDSGIYKNDVWRSTDNGATWNLMTANAAWSARRSHRSVAMPDGSIVLMGGSDGTSLKNDVWRSTDNGTTWTQVNFRWMDRKSGSQQCGDA